ncbi:MAG: hypothetical protein H0V87_05035 [Chloroflexi bacterium]|nr:hypothetical protein [Chloroflexota bacterium]
MSTTGSKQSPTARSSGAWYSGSGVEVGLALADGAAEPLALGRAVWLVPGPADARPEAAGPLEAGDALAAGEVPAVDDAVVRGDAVARTDALPDAATLELGVGSPEPERAAPPDGASDPPQAAARSGSSRARPACGRRGVKTRGTGNS